MEDIIIRSYLGILERNNLFKKKNMIKPLKVKKSDLKRCTSFGLYYPPDDRVANIYSIDVENDGLPNAASYCEYDKSVFSNEDYRDFITFRFARRIKRPPSGFSPMGCKWFYEYMSWLPQRSGGAYISKDIMGISGSGSAYLLKLPGMALMDQDNEIKHITGFLVTLQFWQDRANMWNVRAKEDNFNGTFGVYPEQIKSLFYARDKPTTDTGRKRPILHWVESHKRRIRSGIDIDVKDHLRGVSSFEMGGTQFKITMPLKDRQS